MCVYAACMIRVHRVHDKGYTGCMIRVHRACMIKGTQGA